MGPDATDPAAALFAGRRAGALARLAVLAAVLVGNAQAEGLEVPLALLGLALAALLAEARRAGPWLLLAAGACQAALAWAAAAWLADAAAAAAPPAARALAGLAWSVWFGATVSWPDLAAALRRARVPGAAVDALDGWVAHGALLARELLRRRDAAALRLGLAPGQPRLETVGLVLAGGVEQALDRAAALEDARRLRSEGSPREAGAAPPPAGTAQAPAVAVDARGLALDHPDGTRGLADATLVVRAGEWVALGGPSGSGKSTLLRGLSGLLPPAQGTLERLGERLGPGPPGRRIDPRVALVFQDPADQLFGATPRADLAWGLRRRGLPEAEVDARALAALEALGVRALADRPLHRLSLGERKRVAFAAALVGAPELLLCDEPTSALDPVARDRLGAALDAAAGPRTTVVWATHDLDALPARVTRVVLLREGRVVFDGPRAEGLAPDVLARAGLRAG